MGTFWDRTAGVYDLMQMRSNQKAIRNIAEQVARLVPPDGRVLECAAGTGTISIAAAPRAKSVLCTDLSLPMLRRAQVKAKAHGIRNIHFVQWDLRRLPVKDESFDLVCAAHIVHLLDAPEQAVAELWRVTAGTLVLPTFLTREADPAYRYLLNLYRLAGFRPKRQFSWATYLKFFRNLPLPEGEYHFVQGHIPAGIAVFRKSEN